jgi:hypothetical protein
MVGWEVQFRHRLENWGSTAKNLRTVSIPTDIRIGHLSNTFGKHYGFSQHARFRVALGQHITNGRLALLWGLWHKVQFPEPTGKGTTVIHTYNCSSLDSRGRRAMRVLRADLLTEHVGAVSRQHTVHPETLKLRKTDPSSLWWRQEMLKARKTDPSSLWLKQGHIN